MGTGYTIRLGYLSGATFRGDAEEAWRIVQEEAERIWEMPAVIAIEAANCGAPVTLNNQVLHDYVLAFQKRRGATIKLDCRDEEGPYIHMLASGGSASRVVKEHIRRAFIRLLLAAAHRRGIDLNVTVGEHAS